MKLTYEDLHSAGTGGCGFNWCQLKLLGVSWPPRPHWLQDLIGVEVDDRTWTLILFLKGVRSKTDRKQMLSNFGINIAKLAKQPDNGPVRLPRAKL